MMARQLALRLLHAATESVQPLVRVVVEAAVLDLHIVDLPGIQPHRAAGQGEDDLGRSPLVHQLDRPVQLDGKGVVGHRLEHEIQRPHRIALNGVLGHIGDEHDDHVLVRLPDTFRRSHAIHPRHLNVQENDVIHRLIILQNLAAVPEGGDRHGYAPLGPIPGQKSLKLFQGGGVVLHHRHAKHASTPFEIDRLP